MSIMKSITTCLKAGALAALTLLSTPAVAQSNDSSPLSRVPAGVPIKVSAFGERPVFSPNGQKLAFMSKSYGDVFELDFGTGEISLVTGFPHAGLLRAHYLVNGDLFLIGAKYFDETFDTWTTRTNDQEMWIYRPGSEAPVPLNNTISEGITLSYTSNLAAWAENFESTPDSIPANESVIYLSEILYDEDDNPSLGDKREIVRGNLPDCQLEPQDFINNDTELLYNCYIVTDAGVRTHILKINLETNETETVVPFFEDEFNEGENVARDSSFFLVESNRDTPALEDSGDRLIDTWKVSLLDGPPYENWERLTFLAQDSVSKTGNPVLSPDGKTIAYSLGRIGTDPGEGFGIYIQGI
jgi:hypothetical protein